MSYLDNAFMNPNVRTAIARDSEEFELEKHKAAMHAVAVAVSTAAFNATMTEAAIQQLAQKVYNIVINVKTVTEQRSDQAMKRLEDNVKVERGRVRVLPRNKSNDTGNERRVYSDSLY